MYFIKVTPCIKKMQLYLYSPSKELTQNALNPINTAI